MTSTPVKQFSNQVYAKRRVRFQQGDLNRYPLALYLQYLRIYVYT
jgi:hypothetical protein